VAAAKAGEAAQGGIEMPSQYHFPFDLRSLIQLARENPRLRRSPNSNRLC